MNEISLLAYSYGFATQKVGYLQGEGIIMYDI